MQKIFKFWELGEADKEGREESLTPNYSSNIFKPINLIQVYIKIDRNRLYT